MEKIKTRILTVVLAFLILAGTITSPAAAAAYTPKYTAEADVLNALGIFKGTDRGYELGRTPTRTEILVLLIRLLGKEAEARDCVNPNPFKDVDAWADRYVAWAYDADLARGITATQFGGNTNANAQMFVTLVLRALGYDDAAGDFSYASALQKAADIGLIPEGSYKTAGFYRDDCVHLCYTALKTEMKTANKTLADKLALNGAISRAAAVKYGLLPAKASYTVACVGDSFTSGFGLDHPETESYPNVLAAMTGAFKFTTEDYSYPMVTVNDESKLAFAKTKTYAASLQTDADIILIVMGANDAIWTPDKPDLASDFKKLLSAYIDLPQAPKVIVMTPPRLIGMPDYDARMAKVVETELAVAGELKLDIIDVYAFSEGKSQYTKDNVHFNAQGHMLVAEFIYKQMSAILSK